MFLKSLYLKFIALETRRRDEFHLYYEDASNGYQLWQPILVKFHTYTYSGFTFMKPIEGFYKVPLWASYR